MYISGDIFINVLVILVILVILVSLACEQFSLVLVSYSFDHFILVTFSSKGKTG